MSEPLVSMLIPIYNVESHIENCLNSIFNQTYKNIEFIFIDDCSPDNSILLLNKLLKEHNISNYKLIRNKENKGIAKTRNIGLQHITGEYLIQVDSDDMLAINAVELMVVEAVRRNADIILSNQLLVKSSLRAEVKIKFDYNLDKYLRGVLLRKFNFNVPGKLIRSSMYEQLDFVENIDFGEDYLIYTKLLYAAKTVGYIDLPLYHYVQDNELSATKNVSRKSIYHLCKAQLCINEFFYRKVDDTLIAQSTAQVIVHMIKSSGGSLSILKMIYDFFQDCDKNVQTLSCTDRLIFSFFIRKKFKLLHYCLNKYRKYCL